MINKSS